ncbi:MAG TPA: Hsp20 family protein [Polyangiaceae bacterium]|nr:Hsp20 family protein [Polyangiaceae bacterium]
MRAALERTQEPSNLPHRPSAAPHASVAPDTSQVDDSWYPDAPRYSMILDARARATNAPPTARAATLLPRPVNSLSTPPPPTTEKPRELAFDVYESPHAWLILVDAPGVDPDWISLSLGSRALHLEASVPTWTKQAGLKPGRYEMTVEVPAWVEADAIDAAVENGLMRIRIAATKSGPRTIAILGEES